MSGVVPPPPPPGGASPPDRRRRRSGGGTGRGRRRQRSSGSGGSSSGGRQRRRPSADNNNDDGGYGYDDYDDQHRSHNQVIIRPAEEGHEHEHEHYVHEDYGGEFDLRFDSVVKVSEFVEGKNSQVRGRRGFGDPRICSIIGQQTRLRSSTICWRYGGIFQMLISRVSQFTKSMPLT